MKTCPNCGFQNNPTETSCSKCGVVFQKWVDAKEAKAKATTGKKMAAESKRAAAKKLRMEWEAKRAVTARIVRSIDVIHKGGTEHRLEKAGKFFYVLGAILFFAGILLIAVNPIWIAVGVIGLIQGVIVNTIFAGGSDIVRLLKKLNGLPYGGRISITTPEGGFRNECSECGYAIGDPNTKFCPQCGRIFTD